MEEAHAQTEDLIALYGMGWNGVFSTEIDDVLQARCPLRCPVIIGQYVICLLMTLRSDSARNRSEEHLSLLEKVGLLFILPNFLIKMGELPLAYLITAIAVDLNPTGRKQGLFETTLHQRLARRCARCQYSP